MSAKKYIKPPLGIMPRVLFEEHKNIERYYDLCGVISRYYNAGMKINPAWIEEYNDLIENGYVTEIKSEAINDFRFNGIY